MSHLLALALLPSAWAQEAARVDPPLPVHGDPWSAEIRTYALPPQDVRWLTDDAPFRSCSVDLSLRPDGGFDVRAGTCPEGMAAAAEGATRAWSFGVPQGVEGPTRLRVDYVFQYSATLGTTTLHAEVDPGAAARAEQGVPGLQLVHRAGPKAPIEAKLPKAAKKAGLGALTCKVEVQVGADGRPGQARALDCPEPVAADAVRRVSGARMYARTVDGMLYEDRVVVDVSYGG